MPLYYPKNDIKKSSRYRNEIGQYDVEKRSSVTSIRKAQTFAAGFTLSTSINSCVSVWPPQCETDLNNTVVDY